MSDSLKAKSIADNSYKILREARQGKFNVGSGLSASVNRLSFYKGHPNDSRNRDDRFNVDSESKYSYRNTSRKYRHDEDGGVCEYKPRNSNNVCYLCHRLGHIAIYCKDVKC